jgi:hypothetical protein
MKENHPLLPELADWNDGRGLQPLDWLHMFAKSDVAVSFSYLFWPRFVAFEDHILREGFSEPEIRYWQQRPNTSRKRVEAALNTLHIDDLFSSKEEWSVLLESRCVYLVHVLADVHRLKLAHDFPNRTFEVEVFDGAQNQDDISLSFWQT